MEQYIKKSILVTEIERLIAELVKEGEDTMFEQGRISAFEDVKVFINHTLEMKEVDLENSMVCKVDWYDGFFLDYTQEQQDALLEKIGANVGDKIRVILIKE